MEQSPPKAQPKGHIEVQTEDYVQAKVSAVKQDSLAKARHLLADQKVQFVKTSEHFEQVARDEVTAQVAHNS